MRRTWPIKPIVRSGRLPSYETHGAFGLAIPSPPASRARLGTLPPRPAYTSSIETRRPTMAAARSRLESVMSFFGIEEPVNPGPARLEKRVKTDTGTPHLRDKGAPLLQKVPANLIAQNRAKTCTFVHCKPP